MVARIVHSPLSLLLVYSSLSGILHSSPGKRHESRLDGFSYSLLEASATGARLLNLVFFGWCPYDSMESVLSTIFLDGFCCRICVRKSSTMVCNGFSAIHASRIPS